MISARLQHIQLGAGLAAAIGCLALGALSLSVGLADYSRVRDGAKAFKRFELVSTAINSVVAERAPANVLIASGTVGPDGVRTLQRARERTDRQLDLVQSLLASDGSGALYSLNEMRARLAVARQLVDAFIVANPVERRSEDFRVAMEEMFATASTGNDLRDKIGQGVIAIVPEVSVEVFLSLTVSGLRDLAGQFGSYVVLTQREGRREAATQAKVQAAAGRLASSKRILSTLANALPGDNKVMPRLGQVEQQYFDAALQLGFDTVARAGSANEVGKAEFALGYSRGLAVIDGLREVISESSDARLTTIGNAAFNRAAIAALLTLLVCVILAWQIVIFRRALFAPLVRAREQAIAIARGDLSEPTANARVGGEVGEMLAGLDAIRGDQRRRRELEEQQSEMSRQLKRLSETDMLTGLLNRRAMEELATAHLEEADKTGTKLALLLFDVDHFKSINDTFGHGSGDDVLRSIAHGLSPHLRPQDHFARFGGEEFVVLMPDIEAEEARAIASTLRGRFPEEVRIPGESRRITASFGLALREPGSALSWEALVAMADRRLYAAKRSGRDRVCETDLAIIPSVVA